MSQILKTFVSKFIKDQTSQAFPNLYIVDKQTGPFRSIQAAIDAAQPNGLIKISQGFYQQQLVIRKPLSLQPKQGVKGQGAGVVVLAGSGIGVHICVGSQQQVRIIGLKFSHSGSSNTGLKNQMLQHQHILNIFQTNQSIQQLQSEFINRMSFSKMQNIMVLLQKGNARLDYCLFSLNYIVKACNTHIPAIWVQRQASLRLIHSQVRGHPTKQTVGVINRLGTLYMQSCVIRNHKLGGVLVWGLRQNTSSIVKCVIEYNQMGIHVVGQEFKLKITKNTICHNKIGIKVGLACQTQITRNAIMENIQGIQITSAFPVVSLNKIQKNTRNGVVCRSYKKFICRAIIKGNIGIAGNSLNGVLIQGQNNRTQVLGNHMIGFNLQAGIRVQKQAFPTLNNNKVYKNHKEGVLVVQNSNALLQKNDISHNMQCNVALGGQNCHHSLLVQNKIHSSPATGVYIIHGHGIKLTRNDICLNQNGIIMVGSQPHLIKNYVCQNRSCGIVCQGNSFPKMTENIVSRNAGVGVLVREGSLQQGSQVHSNVVVSNQIDVGLGQYNGELCERIASSNTVEKDIYYPDGIRCQVM